MPFIGLFNFYDIDNDGYISRREIFCVIETMYIMFGNMFSHKEGKGQLKDKVDSMFGSMDRVCIYLNSSSLE